MQQGFPFVFTGPLHTRRCGGTLSKQERAGGFPHPSGPAALPPSPEGKATSGGGFIRQTLGEGWRLC